MLKTKKIHRFTLVELIVSMAVFALLSMMVVQLFSATQKLWVNDVHKNEMSADGRMALDLIASLLTSAYCSPTDTDPAGCDYFYLDAKGVSVFDPRKEEQKETSQLCFVTKTSHPGMTYKDSIEKIRFVGIQLAKISGASDDPDNNHAVLTVVNLTDTDSDFKKYFPDSKNLDYSYFDNRKNYDFSKVVQTTESYQVSRIASNVVDFQVVAYDTLNNFENGSGSSTAPDMPFALEITLVLMDKTHYEIYIDSETDNETKKTLYNQYARTFRRTVFLNGDFRTKNIGDDIKNSGN